MLEHAGFDPPVDIKAWADITDEAAPITIIQNTGPAAGRTSGSKTKAAKARPSASASRAIKKKATARGS